MRYSTALQTSETKGTIAKLINATQEKKLLTAITIQVIA
jgi:hypothetical protein